MLRGKQWSQLDLLNLIEEIESLGKQQRQELRKRLSVLIGHLLKWEYQPQCRSQCQSIGWLATIRVQRRDILSLLKDNPSLKSALDEIFKEAYQNARDLAMGETDLPEETFPVTCFYSLADILSHNFYPREGSELLENSEF